MRLSTILLAKSSTSGSILSTASMFLDYQLPLLSWTKESLEKELGPRPEHSWYTVERISSQTLGNESEFKESTEPKIARHPLEFEERRLLNERISTKPSSFQ